MKRPRPYACLILVLAFACNGCGKTLTRSNAKALVEKAGGYPKDVTSHLPTGKLILPPDFFENTRRYLGAHTGPRYKALEAAGLLRIQRSCHDEKKEYLWIQTTCDFTVKLTDEGMKYATAFGPNPPGGNFLVKLCDHVVDKITGITFAPGEKSASIEFSLKYEAPTPFALHWGEGNPVFGRPCGDAKENGRVTVRLYDDGWR